MIRPSSSATEENRFRSAVATSWNAVFAFAKFCHSKRSFDVWIPAPRMRVDFEHRNGFGDMADLWVRKPGDQKWVAVEVKCRELTFTCADDYPYPTVFVDRKEKADKARPYAYICLNKAMTHAAVIYGDSRSRWISSERHDRVKQYPLSVYECPLADVTFVQI